MFSRVWKPDETLALVFEIVHLVHLFELLTTHSDFEILFNRQHFLA